MKYLEHLTLCSGQTRRSPHIEVARTTIDWLRPWLGVLLKSGTPQPLPEPSLSRYSAAAHIEHGGLVMTVFADAEPLVTFAVAGRSRHSAPLWSYMRAQHSVASGLAEPAAPWLAVALRPGLAQDAQASEWLGDFERCVAWTFLSK